jgi:hypothetical protein
MLVSVILTEAVSAGGVDKRENPSFPRRAFLFAVGSRAFSVWINRPVFHGIRFIRTVPNSSTFQTHRLWTIILP